MENPLKYVRDAGKIAEGTMCYTGDVLSKEETKYTLDYYKHLAKQLVDCGSHIIGIKDMAGLLKPKAAFELVSALKEEVDVPIHLHTHDTTGNGMPTYIAATKAGVDVIDVAASALSGTTSQPSMGAFIMHWRAMFANRSLTWKILKRSIIIGPESSRFIKIS